ncbi:MAG: hypothetical protein KGH75_00230 [Rhodospirillales bacterium]|nr:hypothetical protein [Rhodospirillales bacterium]
MTMDGQGVEPADSVGFAPRRYTLSVAKCDCCQDVTLHMGLFVPGLPKIIDVQFDVRDIPHLVGQLSRAYMNRHDAEGAIDAITVAVTDWHGLGPNGCRGEAWA